MFQYCKASLLLIFAAAACGPAAAKEAECSSEATVFVNGYTGCVDGLDFFEYCLFDDGDSGLVACCPPGVTKGSLSDGLNPFTCVGVEGGSEAECSSEATVFVNGYTGCVDGLDFFEYCLFDDGDSGLVACCPPGVTKGSLSDGLNPFTCASSPSSKSIAFLMSSAVVLGWSIIL